MRKEIDMFGMRMNALSNNNNNIVHCSLHFHHGAALRKPRHGMFSYCLAKAIERPREIINRSKINKNFFSC